MLGMLLGAWRYRFFILSSIKTELRVKFIRSRLGGLWLILNPLCAGTHIRLCAFRDLVLKAAGYRQPICATLSTLMAGILGWSLFIEIVNRCLTLFIDNGNILKKLVFPKIALPLIVTGSASVNNALLFFAILLIFGVLGHVPGSALIWLPVLMVINIALALGLGLAFGVLNVFMRDIGQIVPVVLQFLFWFTPIVYTVDIIPKEYRDWLILNPLVPIITGYQSALLYNRAPDWAGLGVVALEAVGLLASALVLFRKASPEMVDQL